MDELTSLLQDKLKVSALTKSKDVSKYVRNVTLGPNAGDSEIDNLQITIFNKENNEPSPNKAPISQDNYAQHLVSKRIFAEAENLRRNEVWNAIENRIRLFKEQERLANNVKNNAKLKSQQKFLERIDQQENALKHQLQTIELQVKAESAHLKEVQKLNEQKRSATKQGIHDEYNQKEKLKLLEELLLLQSEFREYYTKILKTCEQNNQINDIFKKHSGNIKIWTQSMEKIVNNFTNQNMDEDSLKNAKELVENVKSLYKVVVSEINVASQEKQKPVEVKTEVAPIPAVAAPVVTKMPDQKKQVDDALSQYVSTKSFGNYREIMEFLRNYEASYQNLIQDEKYKKYRFDCQKAINMPVNAITSVSGQHLSDKYNRLVKFLTGRVVEIGSTQVTVTQHPEALAYCTDLLAKKFVRQGDLTVSSNPKSAFAFAAVIVALWVKFPDFGKLLLANFYRDCIYLVPMYLPKGEGQTNQEYYKALNYRYIDDEVEEQDKFLKRMTGIIRLYCAIMVTKQRQMNANVPHPFGIRTGWNFLANILNLTPRLDITATVIYNILDVIGYEMLAKYGRQFRKIINFISKDYIPRLEQIDSGGPVVRLQVFLNDVQKTGRVEQPDGILPNDFW